jgi:farnesyl-diphosphate farnesyltransferase
MTRHDLDADRLYCRRVLPRVSRTFAVNIRLLRGEMGDAVRVGYLLCRTADALEDSWPGAPDEIAARFSTLVAAMDGSEDAARALAEDARPRAGDREDLLLVSNLPRVWRVFRALPGASPAVLAETVKTMAAGMSRFASRASARGPEASYIESEAELHDYCFCVAGCVGVMLTRLAAERMPASAEVQARRLELAPIVGEALQLTNILLDWPRDARRGRCHVPADWLRERGLTPRTIVGEPRPGIAELQARLEALALRALRTVPDYVALFPARFARYRLFSLWPALWAAASLRHARRDPEFPWGPRRPRLPRSELWRLALASLLLGHSERGVSGAYARVMQPLLATE